MGLIARGLMPKRFARWKEGVGKMEIEYGRIKCKSLRVMKMVRRWRSKMMVRMADMAVMSLTNFREFPDTKEIFKADNAH